MAGMSTLLTAGEGQRVAALVHERRREGHAVAHTICTRQADGGLTVAVWHADGHALDLLEWPPDVQQQTSEEG
jgi:hypothetical protein